LSLSLYNTLTRKREPFVPLDPQRVGMYVCGPTVYDRIHIGNARPAVVFDVLFRRLRALYGDAHVTYARNITDVDDKIIDRAKERGVAIDMLTEESTRWYAEDVAELGCLPPTIEPRATEHVPEMIALIERLIASGHAYAAEGHVLFHVPSMNWYGRLSGRNRDEMIAGARVEVAAYKKDPADFVLWKPSSPDLPGWDSPWGRGRPGWHIECSAMSWKHLGERFDIHGGGLDLIFPHHENEIAQSQCCFGREAFARVWMHNGFLQAEGEKMSKSLGNFYTLRELLDQYPGEAIRLLLLRTHYRQPIDFTKAGLADAKATLDRWYRLLQFADEFCAETGWAREGWISLDDDPSPMENALDDDLNTPRALTALGAIADQAYYSREQGDSDRVVANFAMELEREAESLGLLRSKARDWFRWRPKGATGLDDAAVDRLVADRVAARKVRDFKESDRIRDLLKASGVILEDGPGGTTWRRG
jgi:cysteinyl-tRNA synthetase